MLPNVSVIVPVFNAGNYLEPALCSLLADVSSDTEVIIIDDGSVDGSGEIVDRFARENIRVVHTANHGLSKALNLGVELSTGRFIARMDADDINVCGRIPLCAEVLAADSRVGLVSCWAERISADGEHQGTLSFPWLVDDVRRSLLYFRNVIVHGSVMFRREAFEQAGGYCSVEAEDYHLWLRMAQHWEVRMVPRVLYRYRVLTSGRTGTAGSEIGRFANEFRVSYVAGLGTGGASIKDWREVRRRYKYYRREGGREVATLYVDDLVRAVFVCLAGRSWRNAGRLVVGLLIGVPLQVPLGGFNRLIRPRAQGSFNFIMRVVSGTRS